MAELCEKGATATTDMLPELINRRQERARRFLTDRQPLGDERVARAPTEKEKERTRSRSPRRVHIDEAEAREIGFVCGKPRRNPRTGFTYPPFPVLVGEGSADMVDESGRTALQWAAENGDVKTVRRARGMGYGE